MDARVVEKFKRSGHPLSLSDEELQLDIYPLTRDPQLGAAKAWPRYPAAPLQPDALVAAWAPRAVAVQWPGPDEHRAWVWATVVDRTL